MNNIPEKEALVYLEIYKQFITIVRKMKEIGYSKKELNNEINTVFRF